MAPPRRIGLSGVEVVSPELRAALGIKRPTNLLDPAQTANRPSGLGAIFFPESTIQSGQARTMMGGSPLSKGISPGFAQAVTGSPTGLNQNAQTTLMDLAGMLPKPRPTDLMQQQQVQSQQDDFGQLNQAKVINDKLRGFEEDVVEVDKSNRQNIIGPEEDVVEIQEEADQTDKENLTNAQKATKSALQEFLKASGKETGPKEFKDYINEFGEATGLDISGDPDTKQALMSFGLALMQNRAGKGFNISNILRATGEAGEAAMPDFRKAVAEAKAVRAKAGAYALSREKEDQEKAMKREGYFIIPKTGQGILGIAANLGKGNLANLNSYELNNLMNNAEFNEQFEIIDKKTYVDLAKTAMTADGKKKLYQTGSQDIPLFAGADKELSYKVQLPDMNVAPKGTTPVFIDNEDRLRGLISDMEKGVANQVKQFDKLAQLLNVTDITITDQLRSTVVQTARNFGINIAPDTDPVQQIKTILTRIQATNASDILQEAGKTLSDRDRELVKDIVGDVNFLQGDEKELVRKLGNIFNLIVGKGRNNIESAYRTLESQGIFLRGKQGGQGQGGGMTKSQDEEGDLYTIN